jgi:hypothetical protein
LDGNVKTGAVEGLEHDLGSVFSGFRWVQGLEELATPTQCHGPEVTYWFREKEIMVLGLNT